MVSDDADQISSLKRREIEIEVARTVYYMHALLCTKQWYIRISQATSEITLNYFYIEFSAYNDAKCCPVLFDILY